MRLTHATVAVLAALTSEPGGRHWGYALSKKAGVRSGVLYPVLHRLLDEGWLVDGWEEMTGAGRQRPPRRYYELTDVGRHQMSAMLAKARQDNGRFSHLSGTPSENRGPS